MKSLLDLLTPTEQVIVSIGIALILGWLVCAIRWLKRVIKTYTFGDPNQNPYKDETLGLPPGTLRAFLTLTITVVVIIYTTLSMLVAPLQGAYDEMLTAFEIVLAFYFGSRIVNSVTKTDEKKTEKRYEAEERKSLAEADARKTIASEGKINTDAFFKPGAIG